MCFTVSREISHVHTWSRKRTAYKVLRKRKDGRLAGPFYPKQYKVGQIKVRDEGETWQLGFGGSMKAHHGIYVYDTLEAARAACDGHGTRVIVRCRVDPKHLLHASGPQLLTRSIYKTVSGRKIWQGTQQVPGRMATYQQIKVLEIVS